MNKSSAMALPLLLLLQQLLLASASPIRYDQRQEGDSNVDARLQNFFVVLAPSNTGQLSGASLLDLASKAVPLRLRPPALKQREEVDADQGQETKEGKTARAVGAVPIPAAILQSPLAKLHPEVQAIAVEEVLIAQSPLVALKSPAMAAPAAVPMLVAVPVPEVAPERPAPPALLPMNTAGLPSPLGNKPAAPEAAPAAPINAIPEAAAAAPVNAVPEAVAEAAAVPVADTVAAVAAVVEAAAAAPALVEPAQPAVETNQVEPDTGKNKDDEEVQDVDESQRADQAHLIGTGIEECGPGRVRNVEGVCVEAASLD